MKSIRLLLFTLLISFTIHSQETLAVSGGEGTGSGGTSSYTLGQVFYTEATASSGSISEGVQQSFELYTLSNSELTSVNLEAVVYPNPSSDYVMLNIKDTALENLSYILMDIQGKVVSFAKIRNPVSHISLHGLAAGPYVFRVNQKNNELKTFKIIKK